MRGQSDDLEIQNSTWASGSIAAPRGRGQDTGQPERCRFWNDVEVLGLGDGGTGAWWSKGAAQKLGFSAGRT